MRSKAPARQTRNKPEDQFWEYQRAASVTCLPHIRENIDYLIAGLASEAGEVAALRKRELRDGEAQTKETWAYELGDCLWYLSQIARVKGIPFMDVPTLNLEKLCRRMKARTIKGKGKR